MTKKEFAAALDSALKAVRKEYGFTQEKMAAVLGISKKTLVEIEKGRSSLGWTGAAAFAAIFRESCILQAQFGGRFDLVFTGTFTPAQSLETVITAVQDARSRGADMLHLLLVGDGMSRAALKAKVKELHAEDAVTFYGSVPATDIPKFTALADALIVCLSDSPDLGLTVPAKVASYMAAGKPVLASMDGAGNAAVAAAGGLSSPACDAAALADNLLALTRMDAAQRAAMGQSAKEYYLAHYRRSELLRKLEHFILEDRV